MRTQHLAPILLASVAVLAPAAWSGTCTVTRLRVLARNSAMEVPIPALVLPTAVDEGTGTISLDLTDFPQIPLHIVGYTELDIKPSVYTGIIDSAGNISVFGVEMNLFTESSGFAAPMTSSATLTTGIQAVTVGGSDYAAAGAVLDFDSGEVMLSGQLVAHGPEPRIGIGVGVELDARSRRSRIERGSPRRPLCHGSGAGRGSASQLIEGTCSPSRRPSTSIVR